MSAPSAALMLGSLMELDLQSLRIDRQRPDGLVSGEDRVVDAGRRRRHARFSNPARRMITVDEMDMRVRRDIDPRDHVVGKVALLDPALLGVRPVRVDDPAAAVIGSS
jgi:hypothetical protein